MLNFGKSRRSSVKVRVALHILLIVTIGYQQIQDMYHSDWVLPDTRKHSISVQNMRGNTSFHLGHKNSKDQLTLGNPGGKFRRWMGEVCVQTLSSRLDMVRKSKKNERRMKQITIDTKTQKEINTWFQLARNELTAPDLRVLKNSSSVHTWTTTTAMNVWHALKD